MRNKIFVTVTVLLAALLLTNGPVAAEAARLITGKQIKNNSVTGKDIAENTLGRVPKAGAALHADRSTRADRADRANRADVAKGLAVLGSGETQSGSFSAAGANSSGAGGWLGFDINYPRALTTAIADNHIVDTVVNPDPANCPGAGHAAPGYLCLYFQYHQGVAAAYGYSTDPPYSALPVSVGVGLYVPVTGSQPYVNGVWTVTAP